MKARYLTFISYIGTPFRCFPGLPEYRSSEKIWEKAGANYADPQSVQGLIEIALTRLKSLNYPKVTLSSRTDGGVHALNTSAHFDLERYGNRIYEPSDIVFQLNKYFHKTNTSITVTKCLRVKDNFHARYQAIRRTYLYRLAVLKQEIDYSELSGIGSQIPIQEWRRCHFTRAADFDIEKFKAATKYLVGYHDFTTFKKSDKSREYKHSRREIYSIDVRPGRAQVLHHSGADSRFDYWDIEIRGRAFVHNQIRRMVGTLISVAIGKLPAEEIKVMLQVPSKHSWHHFIKNCPPEGLYLCNVEYNPEDLIFETDDEAANKIDSNNNPKEDTERKLCESESDSAK